MLEELTTRDVADLLRLCDDPDADVRHAVSAYVIAGLLTKEPQPAGMEPEYRYRLTRKGYDAVIAAADSLEEKQRPLRGYQRSGIPGPEDDEVRYAVDLACKPSLSDPHMNRWQLLAGNYIVAQTFAANDLSPAVMLPRLLGQHFQVAT